MTPLKVAGLAGFAMIAWTAPAYAYLDPGTGTFILQVLAGALVGGMFFIRRIGNSIREFFGGAPATSDTDAAASGDKNDDKPA